MQSPPPEQIERVIEYHERTKHHPERYARSLGYLDWANQPNPFREYVGAPRIKLPFARGDDTAPFASLGEMVSGLGRPLSLEKVSLFLELSLALSAWKQSGDSRWALRVNPSSGNLHPTEGYLVVPPLGELSDEFGVYHYFSRDHVLERRASWAKKQDGEPAGFLVALTSIVWREAWKYGERAFRYCQHDIGHALAALRIAAAALGWKMTLVWRWTDHTLAHGLGLDRSQDFENIESEIPEALARVTTNIRPGNASLSELDHFPELVAGAKALKWFGKPNRLSAEHVEWPVIDSAIEATRRTAASEQSQPVENEAGVQTGPIRSRLTFRQVIIQRRSALAFDGSTAISAQHFEQFLRLTLPSPTRPPFDLGLGATRVHLIIFVHRVDDLPAGLYLWLRNLGGLESVQRSIKANFAWESVATAASPGRLFRLARGDAREFARTVSCHQDIAADGGFSLGMIACFRRALQEEGPEVYRRLFWETGVIGQMLYLGAEALGYRGTGIGCFFDDVLHRALGIEDNAYQSLYHFTVGKPVEDPRLQTTAPY